MTVNTNQGKITATQEVLTYISLIATYAADRYEEEGLIAISEEAAEFSSEIYEALKLSGHYNKL